MDLGLFARVLWRFRIVTGIGAVLAVALAALAFVSGGHKEQWVSYETMLVTQRGFAEGDVAPVGADPSRLTLLAVLYSQFVTADDVTHALWPHGAHGERVEAAPVLELPGSSSASALPIISVAAFSPTPHGAQRLASRAAAALRGYVEARQTKNRIPDAKRSRLTPLATADRNAPKLWKGASKSVPIVVFLTVLIATIGLAFVLENLRPRIHPLVDEEPLRAGAAS